jgi:hypothetical protein
MVRFLAWLFRNAFNAAWKTAWLLLVVLPGYALMFTHTLVARLAGRQERLLPTPVYRLAGFGLVVLSVVALLVVASLLSRGAPPQR